MGPQRTAWGQWPLEELHWQLHLRELKEGWWLKMAGVKVQLKCSPSNIFLSSLNLTLFGNKVTVVDYLRMDHRGERA